MNVRVLLLASSATLNAALLAAFALQPSLAPDAIRSLFSSASTDAAAERKRTEQRDRAAAAAKRALKTEGRADVWSTLHSTDLTKLVAQLRAAGFPPALVRAVVDAEVERQFSPRIKELTRVVNETPYWKPDPGYYAGNAKLFESISQIYRERSRLLRDLLGTDAYAWGGIDPTTAQKRQFGNLPSAKIDLVQRINDDYAEMIGQVRAATQGITLPEDREKMALLEREKRADLAAILTPEELAEYEMRSSPITMRLRTAFTIMDANEAEFRAIYTIHEGYKDVLYPTSMGGITFTGVDAMEKRREATRQINEQVKTALGDARFAQYQRATDTDFQQLYRLGQRDSIPYDTLVRAYDVRGPTAEASIRIVDDRALSTDAKRTALKELAQTARTQLLSTLGPTAGPAYVENARWLTYLNQGQGITIMPDGGVSSRMIPPASVPPPKK